MEKPTISERMVLIKGLKIAVIGAGSTYTPELINGFINRKHQIEVDSLYLMDIDEVRLEIVGNLAKRMLEANEVGCRVIFTNNLEEAVEGADYILGQVRVGKLDARIMDEKIPLKYGLIGQETTGAGGFMNALRTIPVIMEVAKVMERLAPKAWLINFSNPSGIVAEAVLNNTDIKMAGLCNGPVNMLKAAMNILPQDTRQFDYDFVGLNHLCWITAVYADGKEVLHEKLKEGFELPGLKNIPGVKYDDAWYKTIGGLPVAYLNYYYFRDEQLKYCLEAEKTRGEICRQIEAELLESYKNPALRQKPAILEKRGGALYSEAAVSLIDAIHNDKNEVHVVDVRNNGAFSFMDKDDVVEVKCVVNKNGVKPIKLERFDNQLIIGLMRTVKAYEKLTVKAGLEGNYYSALAALIAHPLVGDYRKARGALDEMLEANKQYLPQFYENDRGKY